MKPISINLPVGFMLGLYFLLFFNLFVGYIIFMNGMILFVSSILWTLCKTPSVQQS